MVLSIALLLVGMALLVKGADWFVSGSSKIAKALKIPPLIIGLTLVSMGTSAPEASVSINGAVNGMNGMSVGNVLGSNIFNTLFILGASSLILPLTIGKAVKKYDLPAMLAIYAVLLIFTFVITPLKLDIFESVTLLVLFAAYTASLILRAKKQAKTAKRIQDAPPPQNNKPSLAYPSAAPAAPQKTEKPLWLCIIMAAIGLAAIIFGGDLVVNNAAKIAKALGMSEVLVGLTIVAVGTSLPELVTSVVASLKKENDIAIGNVIGSNIFNIVFILGLSSTISTVTVDLSTLVDMLVMLGAGLAIMLISLFSKKTARWHGALLVLAYIAYLAFIIIRN